MRDEEGPDGGVAVVFFFGLTLFLLALIALSGCTKDLHPPSTIDLQVPAEDARGSSVY